MWICHLKEVVPERTDRNCYDPRYFTSVVRGIGIKFSISNNSTSLFGHWLKYCHCASMYLQTRHLTSNCELVGYCWKNDDTGKPSFSVACLGRYLVLFQRFNLETFIWRGTENCEDRKNRLDGELANARRAPSVNWLKFVFFTTVTK